MIAYDLQCSQGHVFEGWFEDDRTYKSQKRKGLLTCPVCNETEVNRVPSTFAIKSADGVSRGAATGAIPGRGARITRYLVLIRPWVSRCS